MTSDSLFLLPWLWVGSAIEGAKSNPTDVSPKAAANVDVELMECFVYSAVEENGTPRGITCSGPSGFRMLITLLVNIKT